MTMLSPLQNTAKSVLGNYLQLRPTITQNFGENPDMYKKYNITAHNGIDCRAAIGTQLFAPIAGTVEVLNDSGYGLNIRIKDGTKEVILAHLSATPLETGDKVFQGDKIALTGNTGNSTAPHLHMGLRFWENGKLLNADNGYGGWVPFGQFVIAWKGSIMESTL